MRVSQLKNDSDYRKEWLYSTNHGFQRGFTDTLVLNRRRLNILRIGFNGFENKGEMRAIDATDIIDQEVNGDQKGGQFDFGFTRLSLLEEYLSIDCVHY